MAVEGTADFMVGYDAFATVPLDGWEWHVKFYCLADSNADIALPNFRPACQTMRPLPDAETRVWPPLRARAPGKGIGRGGGGGRGGGRPFPRGRGGRRGGGRREGGGPDPMAAPDHPEGPPGGGADAEGEATDESFAGSEGDDDRPAADVRAELYEEDAGSAGEELDGCMHTTLTCDIEFV